MVFKVQDGIEFETRKEWRDYMMATYYSFHDIKEKGPHIKPPGSINGQMFDIINCEDCELVVMDACEQVQIDNVKNCRIFIGASTSTIFMRNCEKSTLYACSRQLRIRECTGCDFYVYSMAEVHIELSTALRFGCFNGGYPEQMQHLRECALLPLSNLWYTVYDHNADDTDEKNWSLITEEENDKPWFPAGECDRAIPLTEADTTAAVVSRGQVGESFSLQQMKNDSGKAPLTEVSSQPSPEEPTVPIETVNDTKIDTLGIETALLVASARAKGIDVAIWLSESPDFHIIPVPDFNSRFISLGLAVGIQEDWETKREIDLATSSSSLATILAVCGAGFNEEGVPMLDVRSFLCMCEEAVERYMQQGEDEEEEKPQIDNTPASPEDTLPPPLVIPEEEVSEEAPPPAVKQSPGPEPVVRRTGRKSRSTSEPPARRKRVSTSATSSIQKFYVGSHEGDYSPHFVLEDLITQTVRQTDLYHTIQVYLGYIEPYTMNPARGKVVVSSPREWISISEVQEAFCAARLHLSAPQLHLLVTLVKNFAEKVGCDGTSLRVSVADSREMKSLNTALVSSSVIFKHRIHADWLRKYLVHLRVGQGACNWVTWLDTKIKDNAFKKRTENTVAIEFRKALAGLEHSLSESDIDAMVKKFDIVPPEVMDQEIKNRVDAWVLDVSGRRDFTHMLNVEYKRWLKDNEDVIKKARGKSAKMEEERKARRAIKKRLLIEKEEQLRRAEKTNAEVTKDIFKRYDDSNRKENYSNCRKFGEWLERSIQQETTQLAKIRADLAERNKAFSARKCKSSWLAPLNLTESAVDKAIQASDPRIHHELRCKAIALKRRVMNDNRATRDENEYPLITKQLFDSFFNEEFYTILVRELGSELFCSDGEQAIRNALDFDASYREKQAKQYKEWIERKQETEKQKVELKTKEQEKNSSAAAKRLADSKKAYKKWIRLHNCNKYYSRGEKKPRKIPSASRPDHSRRWTKDLDLPENNCDSYL